MSARAHCRFENSCGIYYAPTHFSNSFHSQVTAVYVSQELMGKILDISKIGHRYRPQAYLRKSNVFTSVCQEFCRGSGVVGIPACTWRGGVCIAACTGRGGVCIPACTRLGVCIPACNMQGGVADTPLGRHPPGRPLPPPPPGRPLQRTVCILLECILVISCDLAVAVAILLILNLGFQNWFVVTNSWQTP